jgi:predicted outer membrane repeat protein
LTAANPLGRGWAKLQVQACPPGVPFGHPECLERTSSKWIETASQGQVELSLIIPGLEEGTLYRWRARALFDSPTYSRSPWRRLMGQALEGDVRVTRLPADLSISKTMDPSEPLAAGEIITYTLTFSSTGPARGVIITDLLSSEIAGTIISSSGLAIVNTGHQPCCVWQVEDFETGQGGTITITGIALAERFVNTAAIAGTSPDPNPRNNTATVQTHIPGVIFVDGEATGADNGLSWANAYTDLKEALAEAQAGDQIWIAGGVYRPLASGVRSSAFHLVDGVELHGGFAGDEIWLQERDPASPATILSGDINTENNPDDNVYHVITATQVGPATVLESLTISGGNADGLGDNGLGGGLFIQGGSPTLINVTFVGNNAVRGGGLYNQGGDPTLFNVAFSGNSAEEEGGGLYSNDGSPSLTNTTFSANEADSGGGIHQTGAGALSLANSILWGNDDDQIVVAAGSSAAIDDSDIQGGCPAGATCDGTISQDPQFWNPEGEDGQAGTLDDDLRIYTTFRHPSPVIDQGDNDALRADQWDLDGDGDTAEPFSLDLSGRWRLIGFTDVTPTVDMGAYEATIVDVLAHGETLFQQGESFRLENLQLLSSDSLAEALQNYANFNDGQWYDAFCGDYGQIDDEGYCPYSDPPAVRNTLMDAVDLYRVGVGWPTEGFTTIGGQEIAVWAGGAQGVLSSITEIANVHLIFGNEFLVDATDYRFSTAGIVDAGQIIAQELDELAQARLQFELIMELVFRAFNDWGVGNYCNGDQFEQFGVASGLLMSTLNEMAARYYMLRQSDEALAVYEQAYADQYLQMVALDQMAEETGSPYLQDGSWEMLNNLSQMRERAQAITDGLDFFGFAPEYVPLQAYDQLLALTEGPLGDTGLLGTARDLEDQARDAQRTFDANASDMATELDNLTVELNGQLFELCGESDDDYETCDGGLMAQNFNAMDAASLRVGLAYLQAQNIAEQIKIESDRAGQVIEVTLGLGQTLSAYELAIGKLEANRSTYTSISSSEDQIHLGVDVTGEAYIDIEVGDLPDVGFKTAVTRHAGYQHAWTWTDSTQSVWDPAAEAIAGYQSLAELKEAEAQATIEGADSAAVIRNLLLQQSEALEEYEIASAEFNQLAAEHNYLAQRRARLLNRREQAINRVASHNSHLLSPAYRIWRDSLTTQSAQSLDLAAQFAYLTARAAEYELLTPYPDLGQIFRARTANDIRLFLDGLKVWVQALDRPGQLNRYPYTLSLAEDIWGLTDQALDPDGILGEEALQQQRYEAFQELLQANLYGDRLDFTFITALDQQRVEGQYLFSPNIWNNRIAGVGAPLAQNEGIWINIVTRQSDDVGAPEVVLIHGKSAGGAEAYRNAAGEIVYYDPATAVPVGYIIPDELAPANTTAVLRPGINGVGAIPNSALLNLSVAASQWTLRIPADSRGDLDYSKIEDIEIILDTTGRALPDREVQASLDARLLQAGQKLPVTDIKPVYAAPDRVAEAHTDLLAATPGQIGGSYFGSVVVTSPITLTIQVLNFDLANDGGALSVTVKSSQTSLYPNGLRLTGDTPDNNTFQLTSEPFTTTVSGQTVTQVFTLTGTIEEGGDLLWADYSGAITGLLYKPILVQGRFSASRPGTAGSERLVLRAGVWSVQPGASTTITATLYDETMAVITDPTTINFTSELGTVIPTSVDAIDGVAVVTFNAGQELGQATVFGTNGEITGTVRIEISDLTAPLADFSASPVAGTYPLTVTYTDLSLNDPTGWFWDFGDGTTSKVQHPTHTYLESGVYTVELTASNALAADTLTKEKYVIVVGTMIKVYLPVVLKP